MEHANTAHTPAALEILILKQFPLKIGDFLFIEWPKLTEEILLTTERTALFKPDTSKTRCK